MDAKKLLIGVATTALGFAFGFYLAKMVMKRGATAPAAPAASTPAATSATAEFYGDGYEY